MRKRWTWLLGVLALSAVAGATLARPDWMLSVGALEPAHAALARRCLACHAPGRGAVAERCIACHDPAAIGVRTSGGLPLVDPPRGGANGPRPVHTAFHQQLIEHDCLACHGEHHPRAFGVGSRVSFSHRLLVPATRDRCEACHAAPTDTLHAARKDACGRCHATERWRPATFDHANSFVLDGRHNVTCVTCHVASDYQRYTCYGCHAHTPAKVRAQHEESEVGAAQLDRCADCHRSASGEGSEGGESDEGTSEGDDGD